MQDRNHANKSKPKNDKEKEIDQYMININKMSLNTNNNLITKKNNENDKNNKINKKSADLDNKNNFINNKNLLNKNSPNDNFASKENNNNLISNNNIKKSKLATNNQLIQNQNKLYINEINKIKKSNKEEELVNDDNELINVNNSNDKHNHIQKTDTSIYSYVNRSTQLDYFHDLLTFIKSEKSKSMKNLKKKKNTISNFLDLKTATLSSNKILLIDKFNFNFDVTIRLTLNKFYNLYPEEINKIVVENLIFNKNSHLVSVFKDHMIFDYIDEFLKRFYYHEESKERIPKISNYYKNYLKFFCNPIFRDFKINNIIQGYGDYKAEMYYNRNYGNKANININDNNYNTICKRKNQENSRLHKIFDTDAKINIERNSIMSCSNISIKQQIFNESNFQYYIDKFQINKPKNVEENEINNLQKIKFSSPNDFSNVNASKYTNTLLEFSDYNFNNDYLITYNNDESRRYHNNQENSQLLNDNFKDNISNIIQYKDLEKIIKEQGKNFDKENKQFINKHMYSGLNRVINSEKEIIKVKQDLNDNIIKNNLEKIVKSNTNNNKRNYNSNFNEFESTKTMLKKSGKNLQKDENLYSNRSNEESILSLINIMDLNTNENIDKTQKLKRDITINERNEKNYQDNQNTIREAQISKSNSKTLNHKVSNKNYAEKKSMIQSDCENNISYKILSNALNNNNPYIIKKPDFKENKISIENNSVLKKLNFKNINSESKSKSKSNSKTFTDPNNNSNNAYLILNTSKTLTNHNKSNLTNSSAINIKSPKTNEKISIDKTEFKTKSIFKPKINNVEIIKCNLNNKNFSSSNTKNEKTDTKKNDIQNDYYPRGIETHKKASSKFSEKSNVEFIDNTPSINVLNKDCSKIDETIHLNNNNNFEQLAYKTHDHKQSIDKIIRLDNNYNKDSVSKSNSKDKNFEKKLFSTLDPSNLLLNSQSKFNLFSPNESKNTLINTKLNPKNVLISKSNIRNENREIKNTEALINKLSPSNKNGINSFKANNNIINYNLYNKSLNVINFDSKKINLATNKNSDDTTNTHTKSAEIRANNNNNNMKYPSAKTNDNNTEIINFNQIQEQNKLKLNLINPPQITLNYKINSRNHNQNNNMIKITNSNSNNLATGNDHTSSNVNFRSDNNNKFNISNLKNHQNIKFKTSKNNLNLGTAIKDGISTNNFITNSSAYHNNLNMTDKVKKAINTYSKNISHNIDKNLIFSESKSQQHSKDLKKQNNDFKQKIIKKTSINASNKAIISNNPHYNFNVKNQNNHVENIKKDNSNSQHIDIIDDETLKNINPKAVNEMCNNILINNPNIMNKPDALTDIMKITLSFYMDKSNSRNNRPVSNTSAQNSTSNAVINQLGSINLLNDHEKKTTVINQIENYNKFNININNQINLGNINSINANQLQQINNITNLNPNNLIDNNASNKNNLNSILEYNSKKKNQGKTVTNKPIDDNANNHLNHNCNNLSNNISATTHNGKMLKFNEKSDISENINYGFPLNENKNVKDNSEKYNNKNQESSGFSTNKFNKSTNFDTAYFNLDKKAHISIDKLKNLNTNNVNINNKNKNDINANSLTNNNNIMNSNLKLTFSQDINSLKNIIEKNKILSRNKNANLFKISSNQNMTKPGIISEEDVSIHTKDNNFKPNYINNNNHHPNTILNLQPTNKIHSSVFFNVNKNKNSFSEKSDINSLKENNIQIKAFNSYAHKGKNLIIT